MPESDEEVFNCDLSTATHNFRDVSVFQPPSYKISTGPDKALRWDPPADSDELAIALSYHFPEEKTLKTKMQAATKEFLRQTKARRVNRVEPFRRAVPKTPGLLRPLCEAIPGLLSFDVKTLEEVKTKRKRRAYEGAERAKMSSNRGNACEIHRRRKLKCDPATCTRNGLFKRSLCAQADLLQNDLVLLPPRDAQVGKQKAGQLSDNSPSYPFRMVQDSLPQAKKPQNEAINALFSSNSVYTAASANLMGTTNPNFQHASNTDDAARRESPSTHESQFMGFEPDLAVFDNSFAFVLDPPLLLSPMGEGDPHYSWKPDEFLLSILSHSMFA